VELLGERLTDLARARLCQKRGECVNTVFANRRFTFHKRSQLFVGMHNKTLSVAAMSTIQIVRPLESTVDQNRVGSRMLFLAEFLENRIPAQRVPDWIEP
jgi:hypothetical protein